MKEMNFLRTLVEFRVTDEKYYETADSIVQRVTDVKNAKERL
jgi:hypothetical protein